MPLADHWCVKANFGDNTESAVQFWLIVATYILVWCIRNVMHHWSRAEYRSSEQQQLHKFQFVVLNTNTSMGEFMEKVSIQLEQKKNVTMTKSETKSNKHFFEYLPACICKSRPTLWIWLPEMTYFWWCCGPDKILHMSWFENWWVVSKFPCKFVNL